MAITLSFNDQAYLNNTESVKFTSTLLDDWMTLTDAVRYPMSIKEAQASNGVYRTDDVVFTISTDELSELDWRPRPGDTITTGEEIYQSSASTRTTEEVEYTILEVSKSNIGNFWKLITRNLSLAYGLTDTITISTPSITLDAHGGITKSFTAVHTNIAARVQPDRTEDFQERGMVASQVRYLVYVGVTPTVTNSAGDWGKIVWGSKTLEITGLTSAQRIGELATIEAAEMP